MIGPHHPTVTPAKAGVHCATGTMDPGSRRWRGLAGMTVVLVVALFLSTIALAFSGEELRAFARHAGLSQAEAFAETVTTLRDTKALPPRYVTKREAEKLGWKPGQDLCRVAPGKAIGGDNFSNREKRLPETAGRRWREADLDYACGKRGTRRLVWSSDGLIYLTTDHYGTLREVPK